MAYSNAVTLALLLLFALVLASVPSSSAASDAQPKKTEKGDKCPPIDSNQKSSCEALMDGKENAEDHKKPCCNYVSKFDQADEAASCLCKYIVDDKKPGSEESDGDSISSELNKALTTCNQNFYVGSDYQCPTKSKPN